MSLVMVNMLAQAGTASQNATGDPQWMVYAIIAFGMALALVAMEAFIPSGGVLGILAGIAAVAGIILFFRFDTMWGMVSMVLTLVSLPFVIAGMLWVWPNTPIGRALTLEESQKPMNEPGRPADADDAQTIVVGLEGEAVTDLRPVGMCRIKGRRIDCIAQADLIRAGTRIKVIRVEGATVRVKAIESDQAGTV